MTAAIVRDSVVGDGPRCSPARCPPMTLGANAMFQTVSFDQLAWALVLWAAVRFGLVGSPVGSRSAPAVAAAWATRYTRASSGRSRRGARRHEAGRRRLVAPGPVIAAVIVVATALPNLWWQTRHGWPSVEFFIGRPAGPPARTTRRCGSCWSSACSPRLSRCPCGSPACAACGVRSGVTLVWRRPLWRPCGSCSAASGLRGAGVHPASCRRCGGDLRSAAPLLPGLAAPGRHRRHHRPCAAHHPARPSHLHHGLGRAVEDSRRLCGGAGLDEVAHAGRSCLGQPHAGRAGSVCGGGRRLRRCRRRPALRSFGRRACSPGRQRPSDEPVLEARPCRPPRHDAGCHRLLASVARAHSATVQPAGRTVSRWSIDGEAVGQAVSICRLPVGRRLGDVWPTLVTE